LKIDAKFFGAILFLVAQTSGAIWWASSLSSEVERLGGVQGTAIPALEEAIKGLDVMKFQTDQISAELERIRESNSDIASQHSRLFDILRNQGSSGPVQQKGYGYGDY
jgi:hypothetical protein|tara:strand:+ start:1000 stop:1323 length:324 start_codon:yes stop_codon:yes gene_type:complete